MTLEDFRRLALSFPETSESAHMNHPDFRVGGRIFATIPNPKEPRGMVKLPPGQQEVYVRSEPAAFVPVNGAWGRQGCTLVQLDRVQESTLRAALGEAWQDAAQKKPARKKVKSRPASPTTSSRQHRSP
ncbi:MAG: MmcQ/YjbR family DNA-binding protein [Acidobacteriota bacterium]|nr:MmcQ/YjbR family DNA-binding protein [Acidobacteriota bacterium]